ncbi:hypothetical protein B0H14DRAFT_3854306, partial [Mycena olivaceomarginata]
MGTNKELTNARDYEKELHISPPSDIPIITRATNNSDSPGAAFPMCAPTFARRVAWHCVAPSSVAAAAIKPATFRLVKSGPRLFADLLASFTTASPSPHVSFSVIRTFSTDARSRNTHAPLDSPSIAIQASLSSIAYVRSGPRHLKRAACSSTMSLAIHPTHAHTPSASQESRGRERALATTFSSTAVRTAESCLFGRPRRPLFSTLPMPAPLERSIRLPAPLAARGTICSTTRARSSRPTTWSHARMFLPLDTTPMRIQARPAPPAACDAGLVAAAFPHTVVQQHTAVTALRLRLPYSLADHGRAGRIHYTARTTPRRRSTCCSRSLSPMPRLSPPARCHCVPASLSSTRSQLLSSTGSTMRSTTEVRTKRPSSAPTAATARNLDLQPTASTILRAQHTLRLSPHRPYPLRFPRPSSAPYRPLDSAAHFPSPAPAAFAAMTRLRANSGPTTRRQCAPRASTRTRLSGFASAPVQGDSGREAALYAAPGDIRSHGRPCDWNVRDTSPLVGALDSRRAPPSAGYRVNT